MVRSRRYHPRGVALLVIPQIKSPSFLIFLDQAVLSVSSIAVVLAAGRVLSQQSFAEFSLAQISLTTVVAVSRAAVFQVILILQRRFERVAVRALTVTLVALSSGALSAVIAFMLWISGSVHDALLLFLLPPAAAAMVAQDGLRFRTLAIGKVSRTLVADAAWLCMTLSAASILAPRDPSVFLTLWISGALISCALLIVHDSRENVDVVPNADIFRLGKWSGVDVAVSGAANLLPFVAALGTANPQLVAAYRIFQVSLGPLNILSSTILTTLAARASNYRQVSGLNRLSRDVKRLAFILSGVTLLYMPPALIVSGQIGDVASGFPSYIPFVVLIGALLGAFTAPFAAASAILEQQRFGVLLRLLVVFTSVGVSAWTGLSEGGEGVDPIGTVSLTAGALGAVGWIVVFRRSYRHELFKAVTATPGGGFTRTTSGTEES